MIIECESVRQRLLVPDGTLDVAAESHVVTCSACAAFARSTARVDALAMLALRADVPLELQARLTALTRPTLSLDATFGFWTVAVLIVALAIGRAVAILGGLSTFVGDVSDGLIVIATTFGADAASGVDVYLASLGIWVIVGATMWIAGGGAFRLPAGAAAVAV